MGFRRRMAFLLARAILLLSGVFAVDAVERASAQATTVRLAVNKRRLVSGRPPVLVLPPITSPAIAAAGFAQLADYGRTVYEGPEATAPGLIAALRAQAYIAAVATDINIVRFHDFMINPDTGQVTPPVDTS